MWGSQAVRRLAVNQFIAGSNPAPTANNAGVALWSRAPLLQRGAVEFDPLPRYHAPVAEWMQGTALLKRYTLVRIQPGVPSRGRSMAGRRSLKPSTLVRFQPSAPRCVAARGSGTLRATVRNPSPLVTAGVSPRRNPREHASEAHQDEQAILNRPAVGSIPTGRTISFGTVAEW